jgi:prepilin-type N-terminal cleavage/methylation domain-containing protein
MMRQQNGLTLIEVLIASVILLILLALITNGLGTSGNVIGLINSKGELLEDARFAGQIMAEEISKAVYIYRDGIQITLPTSYTTQKPGTTTSVWTVGEATAPILAMVQSPEDVSITCNTTTAPKGCMTFVAYYPVKRSVVTSTSGAVEGLVATANDSNIWVLFEYRQTLSGSQFSATATNALTTVPTTFSGTTLGSLLADYIPATTGFQITKVLCSRNSTTQGSTSLQQLVNCATSGMTINSRYSESVRTGQFTLSSSVTQRGKTITVPALTFAIAPRSATPTQ